MLNKQMYFKKETMENNLTDFQKRTIVVGIQFDLNTEIMAEHFKIEEAIVKEFIETEEFFKLKKQHKQWTDAIYEAFKSQFVKFKGC